MEAKDLRKGNWYYNRYGLPKQATTNIINQLDEIQSAGKICLDITPIPLTEQWLIDFGFEKNKQPNGHIFYGNLAFGMRVVGHPYNDGFILFGYEGSLDIKYVHQLQNLYFALTRKELIRKQQ